MSRFKNKLNRLFKPPSESTLDAFPPRDLDRAPIEVNLDAATAPPPGRERVPPAPPQGGTSGAGRPLRRVRVPEEPAKETPAVSPQRAAARELLSARLSRQNRVQRNNDAVAPESKHERSAASEAQQSEADQARARRTHSLLARSFEAWRNERRRDEPEQGTEPVSSGDAPATRSARNEDNQTPTSPVAPSPQISSGARRSEAPPAWQEDARLREARSASQTRRAVRTHSLWRDERPAARGRGDDAPRPSGSAPPEQNESEPKPTASPSTRPQPSAARTLAHTLVNRSRMSADEAAAMLNDALGGLLADTDRRRGLRELASVEEERGNIELCLMAWQELAQLSRHDPQPHLELARLLETYGGDHARALSHVRESLKLAPWNDAAHRMARRLQSVVGDDDSSLH